jgi:hypothetical protein
MRLAVLSCLILLAKASHNGSRGAGSQLVAPPAGFFRLRSDLRIYAAMIDGCIDISSAALRASKGRKG